jgi:hypothetical protein
MTLDRCASFGTRILFLLWTSTYLAILAAKPESALDRLLVS